MKLLNKDLANYRHKLWIEQNRICPLCLTELDLKDAVLDHDHNSGHCRQVLHRNCNVSEGKIKKDYIRYVSNKKVSLIDFLFNLYSYLRLDYSKKPIHPTELTELEKKLKSENKRLKGLKTTPFIIQCKENIKEIKKLIKEERKMNSWRNEK